MKVFLLVVVALSVLAGCVPQDAAEAQAALGAASDACLAELGKPLMQVPGAVVVVDSAAGPGNGVPSDTVRLTPDEARQFDKCLDARRG
jgi:hypothetical protein